MQIDSRWEALLDQLVRGCCIDRLNRQGFSETGKSELMGHDEQALSEIVPVNMADDYESFEYLLEHAEQWASEKGVSVARDAVAAALGRAIREGDAKAYLLSPRPPHSQVAQFSLDRIDDLWFYVTPKGKRIVTPS